MSALLSLAIAAAPAAAGAPPVDCAEAYGKPSQCVHVACDAKYQSFLGVWSGPFNSYVRELSKNGKAVFRPYENRTSYAATDCLKNEESGETFIIGRMTDTYSEFSGLAARTAHALLITGSAADGSPFLRIVDERKNVVNYKLEFQDKAASLSIWSLLIAAHDNAPEMLYTTIDGKDFAAANGDRRNVTVTLRVGSKGQPYFDDVIAYGFHARQP